MFTDIHNCCMLLGTADDILILCHKSPDGDTVGAAYGLYHALTQLGRRAAVPTGWISASITMSAIPTMPNSPCWTTALRQPVR